MERGVLVGAAGLRWASWVWLTVVALANLHRVHHSWLAVAAVAVTGAVTVGTTAALRHGDALRPSIVAAEAATAIAVVAADGWVEQGRLTGQTLAGSWPIPSILVAALAGGLLWGIGTAVLLGAARGLAVGVSGWAPGQGGRAALAVASTAIEWIAFGAVAAVVIHLLRQTRAQLAEAEVRERMARDLHDGVLQTLTLIERRSPSPEVAKLARDQERDLRSYLFGDYRSTGTLAASLRACAARFEQAWPATGVTVTVTDDVADQAGARVDAVTGAVTEALTNAAKHGGANRVVLFADVDEATGGLFVTVKDDGCGYDPASTVPGVGMTQSIRDRVERQGGRVDFAAAPGDGVEVRMRLP